MTCGPTSDSTRKYFASSEYDRSTPLYDERSKLGMFVCGLS